MKKIAPVVMSVAVAMTSMPYAVLASDFTDSEVLTDSTDFSVSEEFAAEDAQEEFTTEDVQDAFAAEAQQGEAYVLMNIPYDDFYKAELKNNDVKVDAFTSATLNKSRTAGMMNGNSAYHVDPNGTDVTGVTFPVKVSDLSLLKDQKQVTDSDSVTITVTNRGQTSSNTYTGKDSLIENASYSYYILSETPSYYKELTVNADGSYSFSAMKGAQTKNVTIDATLKVGPNPEEMTVANGYLYVANSDGMNYGADYANGKSVSKIGLKTFTEAKRIPVGLNPTKICSTTEGNVYVLAMGNYNDISAKVQKIDNMNIVTDVTEATLMTVKDNTLYLINAPYGATENTYFSIDTKTGNETKNLIDQPVDSPCGIAVNPFTGNIYISSYNMVGGWPSYTTDGYVNEYSANGKFTNKYDVGVGPCGLTFLLK